MTAIEHFNVCQDSAKERYSEYEDIISMRGCRYAKNSEKRSNV